VSSEAVAAVIAGLAVAGVRVFPPQPVAWCRVLYVLEPRVSGPVVLRFNPASHLWSWRIPLGTGGFGDRRSAETNAVVAAVTNSLGMAHVAGQ
jgi:hypothetical protein